MKEEKEIVKSRFWIITARTTDITISDTRFKSFISFIQGHTNCCL